MFRTEKWRLLGQDCFVFIIQRCPPKSLKPFKASHVSRVIEDRVQVRATIHFVHPSVLRFSSPRRFPRIPSLVTWCAIVQCGHYQCRSRIFNHGNSMKLDHPPNCVVVFPRSSFHIREECAPNPARPSISFRITAAVVGLSSRNEKASADCFNCQDEFDSPASCRNAGPLLPVSVIILGSIVRAPLWMSMSVKLW